MENRPLDEAIPLGVRVDLVSGRMPLFLSGCGTCCQVCLRKAASKWGVCNCSTFFRSLGAGVRLGRGRCVFRGVGSCFPYLGGLLRQAGFWEPAFPRNDKTCGKLVENLWIFRNPSLPRKARGIGMATGEKIYRGVQEGEMLRQGGLCRNDRGQGCGLCAGLGCWRVPEGIASSGGLLGKPAFPRNDKKGESPPFLAMTIRFPRNDRGFLAMTGGRL